MPVSHNLYFNKIVEYNDKFPGHNCLGRLKIRSSREKVLPEELWAVRIEDLNKNLSPNKQTFEQNFFL